VPQWGVCYGEAGEAGKGQKTGWAEVNVDGNAKWDKVRAEGP